MFHTEYLYTSLFFLSKHLIQQKFCSLSLHTVIAPVLIDNRPYPFWYIPLHTLVSPVVSYNGTSSFFIVFCITTTIWLKCCIDSINLFYIINNLLKHNIYIFFRYSRKEGNIISCFGAKLVPTFRLVLFLDLI